LQLVRTLLEPVRRSAGALAQAREGGAVFRRQGDVRVLQRSTAAQGAGQDRRRLAPQVRPVPGEARGQGAGEEPVQQRSVHRVVPAGRGSARKSWYSGRGSRKASGSPGPTWASQRSSTCRGGAAADGAWRDSTTSAAPPSARNPTSAAAARASTGARRSSLV